MSLQVSNQTTSGGRRTPQVYQGFGAVPTGATTTPTATNGSGTAAGNVAGSGSVGRSAKGSSKQSQIPVAIGSVVGTPNTTETGTAATAAAQTNVAHPGTTDGTPGQKSIQSDHLYGMKQHGTAATMIPATTTSATNRSTTNGNQSGTVADKTKPSQQKNTNGDSMAAGKKAEPNVQQQQPGEAGSKLRAPANARAAAQQKQTVDEGATAKAPEKQPPQAEKTVDNSLLTEKSLRGFLSDGEEMESLLLDTWDLEDTQPLARSNSSGKSKAQKATPPQAQTGKPQAATAAKQPDNNTAIEKEQTNSPSKKGGPAVVAVEAEADAKNRSPKATGPKVGESTATTAPSTPVSANESLIGRPLRSISGRRSTRPIADIKFTHHRRSQADQLNDSISSMNVTIGSEIGSDSLLMRTPGSASRKRKDMTPESTSDIPVAESPKRARFDFYEMLGKVATPVTMLKDRLFRVRLQSTPRALLVDEEDASKVVTAEATTTTANVTPQKDGEGAGKSTDGETAPKMEVDVAEKEDKSAETGKDGDTEQKESAPAADEDEVEVKIVSTEQQPQKQRCSIM